MTSSIDFVNTLCDTSDHFVNSEKTAQELKDPLQEVGNEIQYNYYRIDSVVFAEPLKNNFVEERSIKGNIDNQSSKEVEIVAIENVLVHKRKGKKYKKYQIIIDDASNLCCPQPNCHRKFSTTTLMKAHVRKVHCADKNSHICEECGKTFKCRYLLQRHKSVHSKRMLQCNICAMVLSERTRHSHVCEVCGNTFKCRYLLQRHMSVHSKGRIQCNVCAMVLSERTCLTSHMRTHSGIKPHACAVCNKQFARKSTLDTHAQFVHRKGQLQCHKCDERFDTRSQWTRHTSTHHRENEQDGGKT